MEKYTIFTSIFQKNLIIICSQIYIDGKFKSSPKLYFQILNIVDYYKEINGIVTIFIIIMTGKS